MTPKSTGVCDDISLGFAVQKYQPYLLCVFVHNPCGTFVSSKIRNLYPIWKISWDYSWKRIVRIFYLSGKKKNEKFIKLKTCQCWFSSHTQCVWAWVHITTTKGSWKILRKFAKWDCSFWAGLRGTWPAHQACHLFPCCPAPGFTIWLLTAPCGFSHPSASRAGLG